MLGSVGMELQGFGKANTTTFINLQYCERFLRNERGWMSPFKGLIANPVPTAGSEVL